MKQLLHSGSRFYWNNSWLCFSVYTFTQLCSKSFSCCSFQPLFTNIKAEVVLISGNLKKQMLQLLSKEKLARCNTLDGDRFYHCCLSTEYFYCLQSALDLYWQLIIFTSGLCKHIWLHLSDRKLQVVLAAMQFPGNVHFDIIVDSRRNTIKLEIIKLQMLPLEECVLLYKKVQSCSIMGAARQFPYKSAFIERKLVL